MNVEHLRCEYQVDPIGIDEVHPRLSWRLTSSSRGAKQTAYQILVASTLDRLKAGKGDLWDSGKVASDASIQIAYVGKTLISRQRCFWKVQVWDGIGESGRWSPDGMWTMGLLSKADWHGSWIKQRSKPVTFEDDQFGDIPAPLFCRQFRIEKPVASAILTMAGLGYFEPHLNGVKVGDHQLDPGWTDFAKRISYQTFDVTKQLKPGENVVGAMLGNGFYNPLPLKMWGHLNLREHLAIGDPKLIAELHIKYKDGSGLTVVTDKNWRVADGPIIRNSVYLGEVYDARREIKGWDTLGHHGPEWETPVLATTPTNAVLAAQRTPPIRITKTLKPVHINEVKPGVFIVDFGQNFAGVTRMRVTGPAGTRVRLRSGELLYKDGSLNGMTSVVGQHKGGGKDYVYDGKGEPKTAFQIDEYICRGSGVEVFQPRFTFHGFRYVEVTGFPGKPTIDSFEGLRMNSDVEQVGSFECSNPMLNQIQNMVEWTLLSNLFSVQSDCPHREKFGYGGDQVATSEMAMYTFAMARFYGNTIDQLAESVRKNHGFTETAPYVGIADEGLGDQSGPVGWGSAFIYLRNDLRAYYGDQTKNLTHRELHRQYLNLLWSKSNEGILTNGISDHESLVPKPQALTGSAFLNANLGMTDFDISQNDPKNQDAISLAKLNFNDHFLKPNGTYDIGTQCCQAMPLALGIVPEDMKAKVLDVLIKDIEAHDYHLTTGIFGTKYLFQALSNAGRNDIAYRIVNQKTFPGWGWMLANGATTMWEHWEFSDNTYSHNHPMFGSVSEWFYKGLAGIQPDPSGPGFKKFFIRPSVVGDLTWVKAHHDSMYGRIESNWKREGNKLTITVVVPPNTSATVFVPGTGVTEGGKTVKSKVEVGSGTFVFESRLE